MKPAVLYQHFGKDEKFFVDKSLDIVYQVTKTYSIHLTEFLNPRQVFILRTIATSENLQCYISSDYYPNEMARVIVAPDYYQLEKQDFALALLEIQYTRKFNSIRHAQILGTLLHRFGLKRSTFGDILINSTQTQLVVDERFAHLLVDEMTKIGQVAVNVSQRPLQQMIQADSNMTDDLIFVSSMRIDQLISGAFHLSRKVVLKLLLSDKVRLNYETMEKASVLLKEGDLLSVRGYGRLKVKRVNGRTKSGRIKVSLGKIKNR